MTELRNPDSDPDRQIRPIQFRAIPLLDGVGAATGACRSTLALLELEGQYVEQAINTIRERLEHRLFLERRDVEMKTQEVDQRGAAQAALINDRVPSLMRGLAQIAEQHLAQRFHHLGVAIERVGPNRTPIHFRLPIRAIANFAHDSKLANALEDQIVASVGKLDETADFPRASDLENIRKGVVVALPVALEQRHPDQPVQVGDVGDHLAIARLENMQRYAQPGKQHEVRQRENRNDSG